MADLAAGAMVTGKRRKDDLLICPHHAKAKVLSDISAHVTFDLARNQFARSTDVMLEANPTLAAPLSLRKPERTFLVLQTPALTQPGPAGGRDQQEQALRLAHAGLTRPGQLPAPPAPAPPRRIRAGRSRRTTGMSQLGRLQRPRPGRLLIAYSHPAHPVRCGQIRPHPPQGLFAT
jgi:hypothetical protein